MSVSCDLVPVGTAKKYAKRLHRFTQQHPPRDGLAWAQEAAARMLGYPDWHALDAAQREPDPRQNMAVASLALPMFETRMTFASKAEQALHWMQRWFEPGVVRVKLRAQAGQVTLHRHTDAGRVDRHAEAVDAVLVRQVMEEWGESTHKPGVCCTLDDHQVFRDGDWQLSSMPVDQGFEMVIKPTSQRLPQVRAQDFADMAEPEVIQAFLRAWQGREALGLWVSSSHGDDAARVAVAVASYLAAHEGPGFEAVQLTDPARWTGEGVSDIPVLRQPAEDYSRRTPAMTSMLYLIQQEPSLVVWAHAARDAYNITPYVHALDQGIATVGSCAAPTLLAAVWRARALMTVDTLARPGVMHAFLHHTRDKHPATGQWVDRVAFLPMTPELREALRGDEMAFAQRMAVTLYPARPF